MGVFSTDHQLELELELELESSHSYIPTVIMSGSFGNRQRNDD